MIPITASRHKLAAIADEIRVFVDMAEICTRKAVPISKIIFYTQKNEELLG